MQLGAFSVSLSVKDLAASRAFYEALGFSVTGGDPAQNWLVLRSNGTVAPTALGDPAAVRDPRELLAMLGLDADGLGMSDEAAAQFPLRVPHGFVARMRHGDPHDPLLRQVMPLDAEMRHVGAQIIEQGLP